MDMETYWLFIVFFFSLSDETTVGGGASLREVLQWRGRAIVNSFPLQAGWSKS